MGLPEAPRRSRVPWALAVTVGLCSGLAGYVIHAARVNRIPKQVVTVKRLTDMPGPEESPAISPDGKMVAFVADRRQIWVQPLAGGRRLVLTLGHADLAQPRWTPDSRSLIYYDAGAIWEIPAIGGKAERLVDAAGPGDLSHDGKQLAFTRLQNSAVELAVCLRDGSNTHTVVKLGTDFYTNLRWAPDDKKIALLEADDIHSSVLAVSVSGGEAVPADGGVRRPQGFTWAPDNSGLIVSTHGELWFIPRSDRASPAQLTFGELSYESPDVSSTGGNLVVSRRGLLGSTADADIVMFSGLKW